MAKVTAKKSATKATAATKTTKPKKPAEPKTDWAAVLRSGEDGVKKWNNLTYTARTKLSLKGADLTGADLTMAKLDRADLRGADLSGALLNNLAMKYARFDEKTKWPAGFEPGDTLQWKGKGGDPRKSPKPETPTAAPVAVAAAKPVDFGEFMKELRQATDPAKLDKAAKMLKAEKFRLYAKVNDGNVVGVVKSQTDPDLVYSCRLASDGTYGCGTQNLRQCGGLAGSPCKHLLVLVVGLSRAGELDPTKARDWTKAARGKSPVFDKDALAETFLTYKGAEAGEVDWRPTETIPEDFYAM